jgi:hypothetical protein
MRSMRSTAVCGLVMVAVICAGASAWAGSYWYVPDPADLNNLDHWKYCSWGIDLTNIPAGETIRGATLYLDSINNWQGPRENYLYIHLLDDPQLGFADWNDTDNDDYDNWTGAGPLVATYIDSGYCPENLQYDLGSPSIGLLDTFKTYAADGTAGFGFDPDCHYWNEGARFNVTTGTSDVPEPSSIVLILTGGIPALGMALRRRRMRGAS